MGGFWYWKERVRRRERLVCHSEAVQRVGLGVLKIEPTEYSEMYFVALSISKKALPELSFLMIWEMSI